MTRLTLAALLATGALAAVAQPPTPPEPKKSLVPTISEIMVESHGCRTAYIKQVRGELAKDEPDWGLVGEKSRELVRVGRLLALNTPPAGTRASWDRLTGLYVARATVLADAAERKDKEEAALTARRITQMCATCHKAHRE